MKYGVCAPVGGYSNHLRWLLYLSNEFNLYGEDKLRYIKIAIYPSHRTFHNWLAFEWRFRKILNKCILLDHNIENMVSTDDPIKIIVLTSTPKEALKSYLKFNPTINGHTIRSFMRHVKKDNKTNTQFVSDTTSTIVFDSGILYNPVLDKQFYDSVVNFLEIENCYEMANEIHKIWYDLHLKAEKDFLASNDTDTMKRVYGIIK